MQFSEAWLRTFTIPPLDTAGLCDKLTMAGLEVEAVGPAAPPFAGVVVARIERSRRIPTPIGCACAPSTSARPSGSPSSAARRTPPPA